MSPRKSDLVTQLTWGQTLTKHFPTDIQPIIIELRSIGKSPFNDADHLPHSFVFLYSAKLWHRYIVSDNAVQVVADQVHYHQVLRDLLNTAGKGALGYGTCDGRCLADSALDGS